MFVQLLQIDYRKRIINLEMMRQHTYFSGMDFVKVQEMQMTPSYIPPVGLLHRTALMFHMHACMHGYGGSHALYSTHVPCFMYE